MIATITSLKGGVGKSTSGVHLAAYYQTQGPTVLVDSDPNRSVTGWARRGNLPFAVIDERLLAREAGKYKHIIIDTKARPEPEDFRNMVEGSDLVIIPCFPDILALETLTAFAQELGGMKSDSYRILLTNVPAAPQRDGANARELLSQVNLPLFKNEIRSAKAFKHAAVRGCLVDAIREDSRSYSAWGDYERVGEEMDALLNTSTLQLAAGN
jgi:chromosome partitioning protein